MRFWVKRVSSRSLRPWTAMPGGSVRAVAVRGGLAIFALWIGVMAAPVRADEAAPPSREGVAYFERHIRPLFAQHCYECHGPDVQESNLRLDSYRAILTGGAAGSAVVPGKAAQSLLLTAVGYDDASLQMPPDGKLSRVEIQHLRKWIDMGAPHPDADSTIAPARRQFDLDAGRQFWSLQSPERVELPAVRDVSWPRTPIDYFVLARLEDQGLHPVRRADARTLIRRVTLDLTGLPPTPSEIDQFLGDHAPDAYVRLVDRLLASPAYGERWGRHWLDVARYADSNGLDENIAHGNAWRYRDYVIASWNADKRIDQFFLEQLAGDLLPPASSESVHRERLIATGFLSLGPKVLAEGDETKMVMDIIDEQIDTVGRSMLGMTLGCARCHDHKFDPVRQSDYYALAGIFQSTRTMESTKRIARWYEHTIATPEQQAAKAEHDAQLASARNAVDTFVQEAKEALLEQMESDAKLPKDFEKLLAEETRQELKQLREQVKSLEAGAPTLPTAMGVTEGDISDARLHIRGSHLTLGETVARDAPAVMRGESPLPIDDTGSGRLQLARWLVRPGHPLTARVFVNRVWRWHFGRGIVGSTENFGRLGEEPTHPRLLDWMAAWFQQQGWSLKQLHRMMVLSETYQMAVLEDPRNAARDPDNRWLWRGRLRRLEAEAIRDALLAVSRSLDRTMGGSRLHVGNREFLFDHTSKDETNYDAHCRSVYLPVIRNHLYDVFQLFDYTDASVPNGHRTTSTVAPQALFMMNSQFVLDAAERLADRLALDHAEPHARLEQLYVAALGRPPVEQERRLCRQLREQVVAWQLQQGQTAARADRSAWVVLCQTVLASNEFVHY